MFPYFTVCGQITSIYRHTKTLYGNIRTTSCIFLSVGFNRPIIWTIWSGVKKSSSWYGWCRVHISHKMIEKLNNKKQKRKIQKTAEWMQNIKFYSPGSTLTSIVLHTTLRLCRLGWCQLCRLGWCQLPLYYADLPNQANSPRTLTKITLKLNWRNTYFKKD